MVEQRCPPHDGQEAKERGKELGTKYIFPGHTLSDLLPMTGPYLPVMVLMIKPLTRSESSGSSHLSITESTSCGPSLQQTSLLGNTLYSNHNMWATKVVYLLRDASITSVIACSSLFSS
jgi:hypothetical protein